MQIRDFTNPELERFRALCNFTADELMYFNLKSTNHSNVQISMMMHVSESQVSKLARRVKNKIRRVL